MRLSKDYKNSGDWQRMIKLDDKRSGLMWQGKWKFHDHGQGVGKYGFYFMKRNQKKWVSGKVAIVY